MRFSPGELQDLVLAWAGVTIAFTIAFQGIQIDASWITTLIGSAIGAGVGVVVHELAHKYVANAMGYATRFIADKMMLMIGVAIAFVGFIFLAPGGVAIKPHPSDRQNAIIAIAGPLSNVVLAAIALPLAFLAVPFAAAAAWVNAFLAVFNMLPFPGFDGQKVFAYSKVWGIGAIAVSGVLLLISFLT